MHTDSLGFPFGNFEKFEILEIKILENFTLF